MKSKTSTKKVKNKIPIFLNTIDTFDWNGKLVTPNKKKL